MFAKQGEPSCTGSLAWPILLARPTAALQLQAIAEKRWPPVVALPSRCHFLARGPAFALLALQGAAGVWPVCPSPSLLGTPPPKLTNIAGPSSLRGVARLAFSVEAVAPRRSRPMRPFPVANFSRHELGQQGARLGHMSGTNMDREIFDRRHSDPRGHSGHSRRRGEIVHRALRGAGGDPQRALSRRALQGG